MLSGIRTLGEFVTELVEFAGWSLEKGNKATREKEGAEKVRVRISDYYLFGSNDECFFLIHPFVESATRIEVNLYMSDKKGQPYVSDEIMQKVTDFFGGEAFSCQPKTYEGCCEDMTGFGTCLYTWTTKPEERLNSIKPEDGLCILYKEEN